MLKYTHEVTRERDTAGEAERLAKEDMAYHNMRTPNLAAHRKHGRVWEKITKDKNKSPKSEY